MRIMLEMYSLGLATKNSLELMHNDEFLIAFYNNMKAANLEHINDRYNYYCTLVNQTIEN